MNFMSRELYPILGITSHIDGLQILNCSSHHLLINIQRLYCSRTKFGPLLTTTDQWFTYTFLLYNCPLLTNIPQIDILHTLFTFLFELPFPYQYITN